MTGRVDEWMDALIAAIIAVMMFGLGHGVGVHEKPRDLTQQEREFIPK